MPPPLRPALALAGSLIPRERDAHHLAFERALADRPSILNVPQTPGAASRVRRH